MADSEELLRLNQRLLDAITDSDWAVYQELCDPTLTAFEPEAKGQLDQVYRELLALERGEVQALIRGDVQRTKTLYQRA